MAFCLRARRFISKFMAGRKFKRLRQKTAAHAAIVDSGLWDLLRHYLTEDNIRKFAENGEVPVDEVLSLYPKITKIASP